MIQTKLRADEALSNLEITGINASVNIEVDRTLNYQLSLIKPMVILKLKGEAH
jgi:hypothetical protein